MRKYSSILIKMAVMRELVLTSARLRRADKLTQQKNKSTKKTYLKADEEGAFAAKPLDSTALYDAIGGAIRHIGNIHKSDPTAPQTTVRTQTPR